MDKSSLHFCLPVQEVQEDRMNLRRLQELSKIFPPHLIFLDTILIAFGNGSFYIKLGRLILKHVTKEN